MLTDKEYRKLIKNLEDENSFMQQDIKDSGKKMPFMKAIFKMSIADNKIIIEKLEKLRTAL
jgi:hypothetical protein